MAEQLVRVRLPPPAPDNPRSSNRADVFARSTLGFRHRGVNRRAFSLLRGVKWSADAEKSRPGSIEPQ